MLRISGYIPGLRHDILELVTERLLKIDMLNPAGLPIALKADRGALFMEPRRVVFTAAYRTATRVRPRQKLMPGFTMHPKDTRIQHRGLDLTKEESSVHSTDHESEDSDSNREDVGPTPPDSDLGQSVSLSPSDGPKAFLQMIDRMCKALKNEICTGNTSLEIPHTYCLQQVNAPRKDIEAAEDAENKEACEERLFDMDEDEENREKNDVMAHPAAERLDILMIILFSYIKGVCHVNGKLDIGRTKDLYRDLVLIFDKLILPTYGSCHVQYIMFYLSGFKLGIAEAFVEHLWKKLQNPNSPAVIRQAAGSYIGSFLARAKFIPVATVKACLELLVSWLHKYIDDQGTGSKAFCDVALHGPFYATCQAVFYVVIFRHRQILDGNLKKGLGFLQSLNFERIVMCHLNPLKVCLPSVVNLFAAINRPILDPHLFMLKEVVPVEQFCF
ncbi:UNVERIFIED_CONTAM: hypothetical protein K2H54_002052 [Gekko kuhli]